MTRQIARARRHPGLHRVKVRETIRHVDDLHAPDQATHTTRGLRADLSYRVRP